MVKITVHHGSGIDNRHITLLQEKKYPATGHTVHAISLKLAFAIDETEPIAIVKCFGTGHGKPSTANLLNGSHLLTDGFRGIKGIYVVSAAMEQIVRKTAIEAFVHVGRKHRYAPAQ